MRSGAVGRLEVCLSDHSTTGVGQLNISNVRLVGGQGLYAVGDQRVVFMSDCEVEAGFIAVRADSGAGVLVSNSDLTGTNFAVRSVGGIVVVERSKLHDSGFGARVFDAELYLIESEVSGSQIIGVQALDRSTVSIQFSQFSENGSSHLSAQSDSRVELFNSEIGSAVDTTQVGLQANHGSKVGLYASDPSYGFWRSASVRNDSFATIEGVTFYGSVSLRSFSKLVVNGTVTEGSVQCQSASDAICDYAASAATLGCMSAPDACEPLRQFSPEESQHEPREVPFQMLQTQQRRGAQGQAAPPLRLDRKK